MHEPSEVRTQNEEPPENEMARIHRPLPAGMARLKKKAARFHRQPAMQKPPAPPGVGGPALSRQCRNGKPAANCDKSAIIFPFSKQFGAFCDIRDIIFSRFSGIRTGFSNLIAQNAVILPETPFSGQNNGIFVAAVMNVFGRAQKGHQPSG